jgi:hypothetical protein
MLVALLPEFRQSLLQEGKLCYEGVNDTVSRVRHVARKLPQLDLADCLAPNADAFIANVTRKIATNPGSARCLASALRRFWRFLQQRPV